MEQSPQNSFGKGKLIFFAISFFIAAGAGGGWFYYYSRLQDIAPFPPQGTRPAAKLSVQPQTSVAPAAASTPPAILQSNNAQEQVLFHVGMDPLAEFREDLQKAVVTALGRAFPDLENVLSSRASRARNRADPTYPRMAVQVLDEAERVPADQRPAYFLAAELVAQDISCPFEDKAGCEQLRTDFARRGLSLDGAALGGVYVYAHDLLRRLWRDYPATDWGQRAFVLLLDRGWDTSPTCQKGRDQRKEVIRQGEAFLQQWPNSRDRATVTDLVGEAYASWWSGDEPSDDALPSSIPRKQEGAEEARIKAIGYFEQVVQLTPGTKLSEFAQQVLQPLRDKQDLDNYRFICIYD
jgi:hypothetical protein